MGFSSSLGRCSNDPVRENVDERDRELRLADASPIFWMRFVVSVNGVAGKVKVRLQGGFGEGVTGSSSFSVLSAIFCLMDAMRLGFEAIFNCKVILALDNEDDEDSNENSKYKHGTSCKTLRNA